jgi:hypothetical protein
MAGVPEATLRALHAPLCAGELVELRATHARTGEMTSSWHQTYEQLEAAGVRLSRAGWQVWYGVNPRRGRTRGDRNCSRAWALCADLDGKLFADDLDGAQAALCSFGLPASAAVATGGGYHPRWFLDEPLDLQDEQEAARYRMLCRRLSRAVVGADRTPDNVSNPERVLRLPGTLNWKYDPPRPVTIAWGDERVRYASARIESWLDEHAPWTRLAPAPARLSRACVPTSGVISDFNARYDPIGLLVAHGAHIAHTHGHVSHLTRPGKRCGTSATYNYYPNTLIVFSENWPPFSGGPSPASSSPTQAGRRGYDPFEIFARLEYGGERRLAYQAARALGYGATDSAYVSVGRI